MESLGFCDSVNVNGKGYEEDLKERGLNPADYEFIPWNIATDKTYETADFCFRVHSHDPVHYLVKRGQQ